MFPLDPCNFEIMIILNVLLLAAIVPVVFSSVPSQSSPDSAVQKPKEDTLTDQAPAASTKRPEEDEKGKNGMSDGVTKSMKAQIIDFKTRLEACQNKENDIEEKRRRNEDVKALEEELAQELKDITESIKKTEDHVEGVSLRVKACQAKMADVEERRKRNEDVAALAEELMQEISELKGDLFDDGGLKDASGKVAAAPIGDAANSGVDENIRVASDNAHTSKSVIDGKVNGTSEKGMKAQKGDTGRPGIKENLKESEKVLEVQKGGTSGKARSPMFIGGIVIGSVVLIGAVMVGVYFLMQRRKVSSTN